MSRRTRLTLTFMAYSTFFGFLFPFGFMLFLSRGELPVLGALLGALAISAVSGPGITFLFLVLIPFTRRLPFILALLAQFLGFLLLGAAGFLVAAVVISSVRSDLPIWGAELWSGSIGYLTSGSMNETYAITAGSAALFLAAAQVSRKLGSGVLWSWLLGKYHRPREETRIFMFLDVKDSTPLAEELGNLKFSELIQDFFADLAYPISSTAAAVSHYIGDEAVIVWPIRKGIKNGNCVRLFFEMQEELENRKHHYMAKFGFVPAFKAGVHVGAVVAAEVGADKSEIVYHGDVVNTTARITGLCGPLGKDLLISADVHALLADGGTPFQSVSLGLQDLKGKTEPIEVFAVEARS